MPQQRWEVVKGVWNITPNAISKMGVGPIEEFQRRCYHPGGRSPNENEGDRLAGRWLCVNALAANVGL